MKHEPGDAFALGFPRAGTRALQQPGPTPAAALQEALPDLSQLFPLPRSWLPPRTGIRGTPGWPGPAPRIPIPLLQVPVPSGSLETHEPGMGEGQQNGLGLLGFFARTLIRCGNQRLKVTYTAIASHAEPNIHRRKYCINYNAEQHSISAIVPLQL